MGAAYLAGLAAGVWSSVGEIEQQWRLDTVIEPHRSREDADRDHALWRDAVRRSLDWDRPR